MPDKTENQTLDLFAQPVSGADGKPPVPPTSSAPAMPDDYLPIAAYAERAYLEYAMSVVKGRALPQVEDGQKPVQRRILYTMKRLGLDHQTKHVKSARVVGDVIGKLHPHGDSSVYEATVRMAQEFTLRYPLVDGQGNFGSRDGDNAAAMRYTEVRLTKIADLLLSEIDQGTVDFQPNYDGAFQEPMLLPARLPILLLNGASGIAVGMATNIPPHNLTEVANACIALIRTPEIGADALMDIVVGPDFPGGGQIISSLEDIRKAYTTGRGSVRVRARWFVEQMARGQWRVIVNELPPHTSTQKFLSEVEELTNPNIKPKQKTLTQEQSSLKASVLSVLETVRDDSDGEHPVRIILEPRSSRISAEDMMAVLLSRTSLEGNTSINMVTIGRDGKPAQKSLFAVLQEWVAFRIYIVTRRTAHRLDEVDKRIHILEGRMIVWLNIEEVIRTIREADDPKQDLMLQFTLSEAQAEDILEIRLRQLARLEAIKIEKELKGLKQERKALRRILTDEGAKRDLVVSEIERDRDAYGDARRSQIEPAERVQTETRIIDEPISVIVSRNGWLRARTGHGVDQAGISFKEGDGLLAFIETRTAWPLIIVDTTGRAYSLSPTDLPTGRGDGVPATSMIELPKGAKIAKVLSDASSAHYFFANSGGYGFIAKCEDLVSRNKAGKAFMTLEPDEHLLEPSKVVGDWIGALSGNGRLLLFERAEMKEMSKGRGVIVMALDPGESLLAVSASVARGAKVTGTVRGGREVVVEIAGQEADQFKSRRARKGRLVGQKTFEPRGFIPSAAPAS
jgi:topoisomerase-4 subunit A